MHCELDQPKQQQQQVYKRKQQQPKKGTQSQAKSYNLLFPVNTTLCAHCLLMKYHSNKKKHALEHTHTSYMYYFCKCGAIVFVCLFDCRLQYVQFQLCELFCQNATGEGSTLNCVSKRCGVTYTQCASLEFKNSNIYFFAHHLMTE